MTNTTPATEALARFAASCERANAALAAMRDQVLARAERRRLALSRLGTRGDSIVPTDREQLRVEL